MGEGYSKQVLQDLTVNSWRPVVIAFAFSAVLLGLVVVQVASPLFLIVVVIFGIYLAATLWATVGYSIFMSPNGGLPPARGALLLALIVLLLPRELLR